MKKLFFLFLVALLPIFSACTDDDDDDNNSNNTNSTACEELGIKSRLKIIGGVTCSTKNSAIVELLTTNSSGTYICSGTIISGNTVLTAAHCFSSGVSSIQVIAGSKKYSAIAYAIHSKYGQNSSPSSTASYDRNDLALVRIGETFDIKPIPVITSRAPVLGEELIVAGYGQDDNGNTETLKAAYMVVSQVFSSGFVLPYNETHTNVCFGDSGGPAFGYVNGTLGVFGVTSSGTVDDCLAGDKTFFPSIAFSENTSFVVDNSGASSI